MISIKSKDKNKEITLPFFPDTLKNSYQKDMDKKENAKGLNINHNIEFSIYLDTTGAIPSTVSSIVNTINQLTDLFFVGADFNNPMNLVFLDFKADNDFSEEKKSRKKTPDTSSPKVNPIFQEIGYRCEMFTADYEYFDQQGNVLRALLHFKFKSDRINPKVDNVTNGNNQGTQQTNIQQTQEQLHEEQSQNTAAQLNASSVD
ncbi:hypothetical protein [Flammeovirga pacifica]|uniref:Uncharacterized protein n=1 Tax=Flammeovirga pacifica TaxID=915059 RepID=A0A1S1YVA8_FLAPC|nr:hypothetical protein [Flammeovirga pacifica]OHX64968.1 hypothetical protein NH26_00695 [Flammeovirga pacifica]